jgi:sucrose-6-phosphate hydrolase SacC (GH32 family)
LALIRIFFKGRTNLQSGFGKAVAMQFFQHYPYAPKQDPMHWRHAGAPTLFTESPIPEHPYVDDGSYFRQHVLTQQAYTDKY